MPRRLILIGFVLITLLFRPMAATYAQDQESGPTYIIQPGDTLNSIAERFGITLNDLIEANGITDPNLISQGMTLIIPGLSGVSGELTTISIPLGESLASLASRYQVSIDFLNKINRLTSPAEIYAGSSIIILVRDNREKFNSTFQIVDESSLLDTSLKLDQNPWSLSLVQNQKNQVSSLPGDLVLFQNAESEKPFSPISPLFEAVEISPLPAVQGATAEILIKANEPLKINGALNNYPLHFIEFSENQYIALQGIHAMAQPGLIPFRLDYQTESGSNYSFEQSILLDSGDFGKDPPLLVAYETIDPVITKPEEELILSIVSNFSETRSWEGKWVPPIPDYECIKSRFGNRRSYNGSDYIYFHTGVDFGVCVTPSLSIYAPANGTVVFAGPLTVRGNTTILDHGWGIYSAYFHQAEIKVDVGDKVAAGQEIGLIGATGRVTGPHLHWEIWVNGVQVQPLDWLIKQYP